MKKTSSPNRILVLGASGYIGRRVLKELSDAHSVRGTARVPGESGLMTLDLGDEDSVRMFPWTDFDTIVDCTGSIDYGNSEASVARNNEQNVVWPLRVIAQLKEGQKYFYSSTHAVLVPADVQNSYTISKTAFEHAVASVTDGPSVVILRIPALFDELRESGLMYRIRCAYKNKEPLSLDIALHAWHAMYTPRAVALMTAVITSDDAEGTVVLGYPSETSVKDVLRYASDVFGYVLPVTFSRYESDGYVPAVTKSQIKTTARDFEEDVRYYLSI